MLRAETTGPSHGAVRRRVSPAVFLGANTAGIRTARPSSSVPRSPSVVSPRLKPRELSRGEMSRAESHRAISSAAWIPSLPIGDINISGSLKLQPGSLTTKCGSAASELSMAAASLTGRGGNSLLTSASTGTGSTASTAGSMSSCGTSSGGHLAGPRGLVQWGSALAPVGQQQACAIAGVPQPAGRVQSQPTAGRGSPSPDGRYRHSRCALASATCWGSTSAAMSAASRTSPSPDGRSRRLTSSRQGRPAPPSPAVKSRPQQHLQTITPSSRAVQATTPTETAFLYTPRQRSLTKFQPLGGNAAAAAATPSLPPASVYLPQPAPSTNDLVRRWAPDRSRGHILMRQCSADALTR